MQTGQSVTTLPCLFVGTFYYGLYPQFNIMRKMSNLVLIFRATYIILIIGLQKVR
nr:MAG TPA: hypothetical protein [Bacteriophage sp.]